MKTGVEIRLATIADLDAITRIEQECFSADAFSRRQLAYMIAHAKGACFVAAADKEIYGYIALLKRTGSANVRIYSIAVASAARGLGIGQALLDRIVEYARTQNARQLSLEVSVDNTAARALYLKNGFVLSSRLPNYYDNGTDGLRMIRPV
ncbi:N-acetyltransferase [uncultured Alistipes sp.]|jgi:ribosomal-protein-alanine acetyltransferase|uniref:GNAT family N-acetyltransferase n=1 Tax=uncultured Alistipes sp. TaxID=538949 RepID=UPI0025DBC963|nr:N-acetyltransferase [uncultured Alistipes sp.]